MASVRQIIDKHSFINTVFFLFVAIDITTCYVRFYKKKRDEIKKRATTCTEGLKKKTAIIVDRHTCIPFDFFLRLPENNVLLIHYEKI